MTRRKPLSRLRIDRLYRKPEALKEFLYRRAVRPSVLRPWHGECLILRAHDRRIPAAPAWRPGRGPLPDRLARRANRIVALDLVVVDADLVERLCPWPDLPERCSINQAARILGVGRDLISRWIRAGLLVRHKREAAGCHRRPRLSAEAKAAAAVPTEAGSFRHPPLYYVTYRENPPIARYARGRRFEQPDFAERSMCPRPDPRWVARRLRERGQRQHVLRATELMARRGDRPPLLKQSWVCPTCGRLCRRLHLQAGEITRETGATWHPRWVFQCHRCAGVIPERAAWNGPRSDGLNQTMLKLSAGTVSGNQFRREMGRSVTAEEIRAWEEEDRKQM